MEKSRLFMPIYDILQSANNIDVWEDEIYE